MPEYPSPKWIKCDCPNPTTFHLSCVVLRERDIRLPETGTRPGPARRHLSRGNARTARERKTPRRTSLIDALFTSKPTAPLSVFEELRGRWVLPQLENRVRIRGSLLLLDRLRGRRVG